MALLQHAHSLQTWWRMSAVPSIPSSPRNPSYRLRNSHIFDLSTLSVAGSSSFRLHLRSLDLCRVDHSVWSLRTGEFCACGTFLFLILKVACDVRDRFIVVMRSRRCALRVMATVHTESVSEGVKFAIPPPAHPTYDLQHVIRLSLAEDAGDHGDVTCLATMTPEIRAEAQFLAKANGVIAGIALAEMVFTEVDPSLKVEWNVRDGDLITKGQQFGTVKGAAQSILTAERVVLNFMQRMSGVATLTKAMVEAARPARILETRKTAPGLRLVDKWAVLIGGGENHRMGLFDMVMVKDNHIAVAGGIQQAISAVEKYLSSKNLDIGVEIETRTLEEVQEVLDSVTLGKGRVTRIMLDNMVVPLANGDVDVSMLQQAVNLIDGRFETEASGNVALDTVSVIGSTGVTFISSGALTHSVKALDISLNVDTKLALEVGRRTKRA